MKSFLQRCEGVAVRALAMRDWKGWFGIVRGNSVGRGRRSVILLSSDTTMFPSVDGHP